MKYCENCQKCDSEQMLLEKVMQGCQKPSKKKFFLEEDLKA